MGDLALHAHEHAALVRCAYCHDDLSGEEWRCDACATAYHAACASELHEGCAVLGCSGRARPLTAPSAAVAESARVERPAARGSDPLMLLYVAAIMVVLLAVRFFPPLAFVIVGAALVLDALRGKRRR